MKAQCEKPSLTDDANGGLIFVICGHIGFACASYIAMCDLALDKPGVLWDIMAAVVSGAFIAAGRRLMAEAE